MKKILITGSGGFIGNFLFNFLKNKKNIKLFGTINELKNKNHNLKKILLTKKFIKKNIFKCDLSDVKKVKKIIKRIQPDVIYHFAAMTNHALCEKNKRLCKKNNYKITNNIINCMNKHSKLIFLSTDKIYSRNPKKSKENTNHDPPGFLAKEKLKCEKIIEKKIKKHFILRLPIVHAIGKNKDYSTIDNFLFLLKKNKKISVFKNVKRSFLKIYEFNKLLKKLIYSENYGIYNVGSKVFSYSERLKILCKEYTIPTKNINKITGNIEPLIQNFDTKKLRNKFDIVFS
jgi:dTDP-4-dehydrorhamnose reductase